MAEAHRRDLLATTLVGALLPNEVHEGHVVRAWLDSWSGIGHVVEEMHEIGYNVRLDRSPFVWWAEFRRDQIGPLPQWFAKAGAFKPSKAVQRAALETLGQAMRES